MNDTKEEIEIKHWADKYADEAIERVSNNPELRKIVGESKYGFLVLDEKTPSGTIHIGSGRGWVVHDVIAKVLRSKGVKATFVLSSDDIDPFDKMNANLPQEFEKYLGVPFMNIPSPVPGFRSFGDYYFRQCTDKFAEFGIDAVLESTGEQYVNGSFNKAIKIVLDNSDKIIQIYKEMYGDKTVGAHRIPFNPICEKCGKIGTTVTTSWDKEKELITYKCLPDFVPWAKGCGHEGTRSPYNGGGKFPWKVEWAAKWFTKGVVIETAGKDHFTKMGSREIACKISVDIFNYPPPLPSHGYETGAGYEFFTVGGKKMSTSKGQGIGFADSTNYAPASMLRFLLVKSRLNSVIDFQPYDSNDLQLLYESYDTAERIYFGVEKADEKETIRQKRIYELAQVGAIPAHMPNQIPFTHASLLSQVHNDEDLVIQSLKKSGHLPESLSGPELKYVKERIFFARKWVAEFAPDQYRFTLQEKVRPNLGLTDLQVHALHAVAEKLRNNAYTDNELFNEFYRMCKDELGLDPKEFFRAAYLVLLNKERGPKLAPFLIAIKEKAISLFEQATVG